MNDRATAALILAGGLGTRMRRADQSAVLDAAQEQAADRGLKAMIPDARGRPFLDHILSGLADAGITDVGLVLPPSHDELHRHYALHPPRRVTLTDIVQPEPRGTADALLHAEHWAASRDFLVLNADNLYPAAAIDALVTLAGPGLVAFDPRVLVAEGNIEAERIRAFALLELTPESTLARIREKPDAATWEAAGDHPWVSMNIWRFDRRIFGPCRDVPRSARGEYELPEAVGLAVERGERFRVVRVQAPVLDLSRRGDVATVAALLATREIEP